LAAGTDASERVVAEGELEIVVTLGAVRGENVCMQVSIEQLFARFAATGDPAALGEVFDRTHAPLLSLALHLCGNPADAEDALQATFVTAIGKRSEWDAARPLLPWLTGVLTLHCKKAHERRARRRHVALPELVDDDGSPIAASERQELVEQLRRHVERLPDEQRQALLLQLEHGLTPAEIAEVLAVPPGTVRMRLHRGLKTLRGVLPAGLAALLLGALPSRGLAAVRTAVLRQAAAVGGGALLSKILVAAAAVLVVALAWTMAPGPGSKSVEPPRSPVVAASGGRASESERVGDATNARVVAREDAANDAADAFATLVVHVVRRATGQPVARATVRILPQPAESDARFDTIGATTDAGGIAVLGDLHAGEVDVRVDGCPTQLVTLRRGETNRCEFEQTPGIRVVGSVAHADGRPAAGAEIVVGRQIQGPVHPVGLADAAGRFTLEDISDLLVVGARMPGLAPSRLASLMAGAELRLVLPGPGAIVDGAVEDEHGAALAGVRIEVGRQVKGVQVAGEEGMTEAPRAQWLVTGADGSFHATDLPAGELEVQARRPGFAPFSCFVQTVAGETAQVRCRLTAGCEVHGCVVDERGVPVERATVSGGGSYDDQRDTDRDGRFAFRSLRIEALQLRVEANDIVPFQGERDVREPGEWLIAVQRLPHYVLRFVDDDGVPMQGWRVMLHATRHRLVLTAADGTCSVWGAVDAGETIELSRGPNVGRIALPCPAGIQPGVEATIVATKLMRASAALLGRVVRDDDAPIGSGSMSLNRGAETLGDLQLEAGRFVTAGLVAGDYDLVLRGSHCEVLARFPAHGLRAGETRDLGDLRLPAMGQLQIRLTRRDRGALVDPSVFVSSAAADMGSATSLDGSVHDWPTGRFQWQVLENESLWQRGEVEVRAGQLSLVDVVLEPGVRRYLHFPAPIPDWGTPTNVRYVLRAPDGREYDRDDFDPGEEVPYRYMPALSVGTWTLELATDDGRRFAGSFTVDSLAPSVEPIRVAVQPSR
jgi:RNA polymerase sigma-70 factor (ECF subfamily)